jgi:signal transduction histidine kinase
MSDTKTPARSRSIARRLSGKLFWRLFWTFVKLDILLILIFAVSVAAVCETLADGDPVPASTEMPEDARTFGLVAPFRWFVPRDTRDVPRAVRIERGAGYGRFDRLEYVIYIPKTGSPASAVVFDLRALARVAAVAFAALYVLEFLMLVTKSAKNARMVRRMLAPISELARAAETLSHGPERFEPDEPLKLAELQGALEGITAAKLDTRINVGGTQKELRELALAINGMLDRLGEAYLAQMRFVSDASHELRTPIAVIQGYAGLLDRWGKRDEKTLQESIDAIRGEAENMKHLVEQLLFLARGDSDTLTLDMQRFDLAELAEQAASEAKLIDDKHSYETAAQPAAVVADRALIKEAVRVLLDNAAKYTDEGGAVTLHTHVSDGRAILSVTDTGVGIADDILPKIFDRFVRADDSRARVSGGSGLGLAIAKRIVTRHGGYLEAVSRVGIGTRITISLPEGVDEPPKA